jgi:hypothetical protein
MRSPGSGKAELAETQKSQTSIGSSGAARKGALDLVSVPGATLLRREDGTEVARFSVWDATGEAIEQAAQEDQRTNQNQKV